MGDSVPTAVPPTVTPGIPSIESGTQPPITEGSFAKEVNVEFACNYDRECSLPTFNEMYGPAAIPCCAMFPNLDPASRLINFDRYCYDKNILAMGYTGLNPYTVAYCDGGASCLLLSATLAVATLQLL